MTHTPKDGGATWQLFHAQIECEYKFKASPMGGWVCATMRSSCAAVVRAEKCPMKHLLTDVKKGEHLSKDRLAKIEARLDRLERLL